MISISGSRASRKSRRNGGRGARNFSRLDKQVKPAQLQFVACWAVVNRGAVLNQATMSPWRGMRRNVSLLLVFASRRTWDWKRQSSVLRVHVHAHRESILLIKEAVRPTVKLHPQAADWTIDVLALPQKKLGSWAASTTKYLRVCTKVSSTCLVGNTGQVRIWEQRVATSTTAKDQK
ncbi:hypothetical protein M441DRAFT_282701 [Trichoderma asperellum CBS 433.97]|uniref:Uncharacterized protein n=1 Tax=Trichoderma asperellum (strain ATCC 204424 / CBS 433.97 / NBRC 101777) TaxID=1042311 RepID=A0A2T3YVP2_TRIA4|nr:hypothetical protein M441DRAFT_282701 [Trichoderma asperellum CBS 433.97]PTB36622.1 hypothetical protein M441DRAFT_282701 [Trichoderma asperellum CBS 433.97]